MTADTRQRILDAVDAGFDAQLATTRDFIAIPSTRGAEGPCQDMIGDLLRQRGYEVDDGTCPAGQVKEVSGTKMTSSGIMASRKCIPRVKPKSKDVPQR